MAEEKLSYSRPPVLVSEMDSVAPESMISAYARMSATFVTLSGAAR